MAAQYPPLVSHMASGSIFFGNGDNFSTYFNNSKFPKNSLIGGNFAGSDNINSGLNVLTDYGGNDDGNYFIIGNHQIKSGMNIKPHSAYFGWYADFQEEIIFAIGDNSNPNEPSNGFEVRKDEIRSRSIYNKVITPETNTRIAILNNSFITGTTDFDTFLNYTFSVISSPTSSSGTNYNVLVNNGSTNHKIDMKTLGYSIGTNGTLKTAFDNPTNSSVTTLEYINYYVENASYRGYYKMNLGNFVNSLGGRISNISFVNNFTDDAKIWITFQGGSGNEFQTRGTEISEFNTLFSGSVSKDPTGINDNTMICIKNTIGGIRHITAAELKAYINAP